MEPFDPLVTCRSRPTVERLAIFGLSGENQGAEAFETLARLAQDVDPETGHRSRAVLLRDEYRHSAIGRRALLHLADTPDRRGRAQRAAREMRERIFAAYRAHRASVDRSP